MAHLIVIDAEVESSEIGNVTIPVRDLEHAKAKLLELTIGYMGGISLYADAYNKFVTAEDADVIAVRNTEDINTVLFIYCA